MSTEPADGAGETAVTDRELFDNAIEQSPATEPTPSAQPSQEAQPAAPEEAAPPASAGAGAQPRDEQGRFATKAAPPPAPEQAAAPTAPQAPQAPPAPPPQDHRVPLRELLDERERRQRIEAENNQMRQAWQQFQAMQQQQALAAQQAQMPQTIYDNPEQYLLQNVIEPLRQQQEMLRQEGRMEFLRMKDEWSREAAEDRHGAKAVQAALDDLAKIRRSPHGDYVFNQIMSQRHPYGALIKWHEHARMQQQIGHDPRQWLQKQQEAWMNDPKVQAQIVERIQAAQKGSNRPPTVNLPPSLSSIAPAGGDEQGDLSDASLYRFATR